MSYADHFKAHLRLTILRVLAEVPGYRANDSILRDAAEAMGIGCTRDQVRVELAWLAEQGLAIVQQPGVISLTIATATERGLDVACGRAVVPGVQRPTPRG